MKISYFLSKLVLGAVFLPSLIFSKELVQEEIVDISDYFDVEMARINLPAECTCKEKPNGPVFASYRNDQNILVRQDENVPFNRENVNRGHGIRYNTDKKSFRVLKAGYYVIDYGLASIGTAGRAGSAFGFNLTVNNKAIDHVLTNSSSRLVKFLNVGDTVAIVAQYTVILIAGSHAPLTTSFTDTAHILFVRVEEC